MQESFYQKIVNRYMLFCTRYSKTLDEAFSSLSFNERIASSSEAMLHSPSEPLLPGMIRPLTPSPPMQVTPPERNDGYLRNAANQSSSELTIILLALRKLREGLLATSSSALSPHFSQRVHVFSIRVALLALHPSSYHPSLLHLLFTLHSQEHPLPTSELWEMLTYMILDLACRQNELGEAFALNVRCKGQMSYENTHVDSLLAAIATNNCAMFWRVRRMVDGYVRAVLHWKTGDVCKKALKTIARSYMICDLQWILRCTSGKGLTWDELVESEDVGWKREGEHIIIRKPKAKT